MLYQHRQSGYVVVLAIAIALLITALVGIPGFSFLVIAAILVVLGVLFSSMTISIDEDRLVWHFSFGFWKNDIEISEIVSFKPVRNKWWNGWGIHTIRKGWLYNGLCPNEWCKFGLLSGVARSSPHCAA